MHTVAAMCMHACRVPLLGKSYWLLPAQEIVAYASQTRFLKVNGSSPALELRLREQRGNMLPLAHSRFMSEHEYFRCIRSTYWDKFLHLCSLLCIIEGAGMLIKHACAEHAILGVANESVGIKITSLGLGPVTSHDVDMAASMGSKLVAFNVKAPTQAVAVQAKQSRVDIASERVIYHLLTRVGGWMADVLPKIEREEVLGEASIMQVSLAPVEHLLYPMCMHCMLIWLRNLTYIWAATVVALIGIYKAGTNVAQRHSNNCGA